MGDPDQHRVIIADLSQGAQVPHHIIPLGGEPGRIATRGDRAVVALREDAIVLFDLANQTELGRMSVCAAPRGIAWAGDHLHVACAGGELVELQASDGVEVARLMLEPDLRDVLVRGNRRYVSVFRSAEVLVVEDGQVVDRWRPEPQGAQRQPNVAWRMLLTPEGQVAMIHQDAQANEVEIDDPVRGASAYGSPGTPCPEGPRTTAVTVFNTNGYPQPASVLPGVVLGVDMVAQPGGTFVVADAGRPNVALHATVTRDRCAAIEGGPVPGERGAGGVNNVDGQELVAVARAPGGEVYALSRAPLTLLQANGNDWRLRLYLDAGIKQRGHTLFHRDTGAGIACAACHPEGSQDGHTWQFSGVGQRRTQDLRGGLRGTEPFHWDQDQTDINALMDEVFVRRMGGTLSAPTDGAALLFWLDALPVEPTATRLTEAALRGRDLFQRPDLGCVDCHTGPRMTNAEAADVGTGRTFAVPALQGLALRAPYMHNGCALTLRDRFTEACGGGDAHGTTSQLSEPELDDLVAYLGTL